MDAYWQQCAEQLERDGLKLLEACNQLSLCLGMPSSLWMYLSDVSRYWRLAAEGAAEYARTQELSEYEKYKYYTRKAYNRLTELVSVFKQWEACLKQYEQ
jgi:hypothetical protein